MRRCRAERLLLSVALALALQSCHRATPAPAEAPAPRVVRVVRIESAPAAEPIRASGVVAPRIETRLGFRNGGVVARLAVRSGDTVRRGQWLAELETTEADAGLAQAQAAFDKAHRDRQHAERLYAQDVISREQRDDLGTAERLAQAQFERARDLRSHARIRALADGIVLQRLAEEGEVVSAGQPVLVLGNRDAGQVLRLGLPDREFLRLRTGDRAAVQFEAYPGRVFEAAVVSLAAAADPRTGSFEVELSISSGDTVLPSGLIGSARIESSSKAQRPQVPLASLLDGDARQARLFLLDGERVRQRRVSIAWFAGDHATLEDELAPGSEVVSEGAAYLDDGDIVRVVR